MVKVCHMTSAHLAEDERIFFKEGISLNKKGFEVYIVANGNSYTKKNIRIYGIGEKKNNRFRRIFFTTRKIYKVAKNIEADIYHFHDPELIPYALKLKKRGKIVIFDSHENTVEQIKEKEWIPVFLRLIIYKAFDYYQHRTCKKFDGIITVTPHILDYFKTINKNVRMVTNYPVYKEVETNSKEKYPRSICFAGGIQAQWNHKNIISALGNIDNVQYILCGPSNDYLAELKNEKNWLKVDYRGRIPHEEVPDVLRRCCVGMSLVNHNNNVGGKLGTLGNTKIYEEMMVGLPVICSDSILWTEMVNKYQCGICVDPSDVVAISDAISLLLNDINLAKQMGENGMRAVREEYNWESQEKILFQLYEELLMNRE